MYLASKNCSIVFLFKTQKHENKITAFFLPF